MATTALLAAAAALMAVAFCPAGAFVQLMGNSDIYCDAEGAYCQGDSSCCAGLECVPRFPRVGGGVCQRRGGAEVAAAGLDYPRFSPPHSQACQADADCPTGQCCVRRSVGVRGGGVSTCDADCSENEVSDILGDFYTRYYRRALRSRHQQKHQQQHQRQHHPGGTGHRRHEEGEKKKKTHN